MYECRNYRVVLPYYRLLGTKMVESGVSPGILPNFLSDYFIDIFGYIDLKIISHKSTKISKIIKIFTFQVL